MCVIINKNEPAKVDRNSVARSNAKMQKVLVTEITGSSVGFGVEAAADITGPKGKISAKIDHEQSLETKWEKEIVSMKSQHSLDSDMNNRWRFVAEQPEFLEGRPWDAGKSPLMTVIDTPKKGSNSLPPNVNLLISCTRRDIHFPEIKLKNEGKWIEVKDGFNGNINKKLAAEAFIKDRLEELGLGSGNLRKGSAKIELGSFIITLGAQ